MKIEIDSETIVFANKNHKFNPVEQAHDAAMRVSDVGVLEAYAWAATYLATLAARIKQTKK